MKKVRISKKNPNYILKAIEPSPSPNKQLALHSKQLKSSLKIQQLKHGIDINKLSHRENIIHSHRYKPSYPYLDIQRHRASCSPRQLSSNYKSQEKQQGRKNPYRRTKRMVQLLNRSTEKSPYLQKKYQNKSQRKLKLSSRNLLQHSYNINKLKTIRLNSHEQKSQTIQIKKTNNSQDVLRQAKKLMLAGESRKSMFILKPLLTKQPSNLSALNIAAINFYNIGDYEKSLEYIDYLIRIKPDYNQNVYILKSKIFLKHKKNVQQCLSQLKQCQKFFPCSEQIQIEKGQVYLYLRQYNLALQCFRKAQILVPGSSYIKQKIIQAYQGLKLHQKILEVVTRLIASHGPSLKTLQIKCQTLFHLHRYQQLISQYSQTTDPTILYYYAYSLYKKGDFQKSFLILQSMLSNCDQVLSTKYVKLMMLMLCKGNDFYEAYHLLERCHYVNINRGCMKREFYFIQGVICMMKRNITEGLNKLNTAKASSSSGQDEKDQFQLYMQSVIYMFLAYGYFSLGNYQQTKSCYIKQKQKYPQISFDGMEYNIQLNQGFLCYHNRKLQQSALIFQTLCQKAPKKIEPHFSLAIAYTNIFTKEKQQKKTVNIQLLRRARQSLNSSVGLIAKYHNNVGANFFYHKSVLHAYMQEWREAIVSVDEAIEKSEENYWRYYYLRALILACIHNFSQAINDCTAAINLKESEPAPFFLRCCCFQIQGEGNYAFKDLQQYIALRPNDKQVHKFAGKLLFENGAFQDAISAFNHEPIPETIQNQDVFLTKSKTYFLLGKFCQAAQQMFKVNRINPNKNQTIFDGKMMLVLDKFLCQNPNYQQIIRKINQLYQQNQSNFSKCQIFKKTQSHTLKSVCYFYLQKYQECINELQLAIKTKQKTVIKQSLIEGSTRQDQKDTRLYASQMNFNISICYLMMNDLQHAKLYAQRLIFHQNDVFYQPHKRYISTLNGSNQLIEQQIQTNKLQIFPSRNKISNYLKQCRISINNQQFMAKLCIPFPKVEPPEIYPNFDERLLKQFTIQKMERKSQAPWISKQDNTIKFTNKIQKYSRLEIEESGTEISVSSQQIDQSHMSMESVRTRRSRVGAKLSQNLLTSPKLIQNKHV